MLSNLASRRTVAWLAFLLSGFLSHCMSTVGVSQESLAISSHQIEADWLHQAQTRYAGDPNSGGTVTPQDDAAGGCDGIVTGKWGFHTDMENDPWWQVDLGKPYALASLAIYNRCDGGFAKRASRIQVLLSSDGEAFDLVYTHDGTDFLGHPDKKPLVVSLDGRRGRFVRLQLPGRTYFHLDDVQVQALGDDRNIALNQPATQSSVSQWSSRNASDSATLDWQHIVQTTVARGRLLASSLRSMGIHVDECLRALDKIETQIEGSTTTDTEETWQARYFDARRVVRKLAFSNPLLDFDSILFVKRVPSMFPHLSDQFYGWWTRPGGGIFVLENFKDGKPSVRCLTASWPTGNFLRPDLSHDSQRVLFAFSRFDPDISNVRNKRDKDNVPADVFYHLFELDLKTGDSRQLTHGKYDDFDGRYLPTGDILFLSTRKGQFLQVSRGNSRRTLNADLPDSYVRCGGDDYRPVPVFTMHAIDSAGENVWPVSAFETFEYTPSIANDGRVLYCRWDYIDRFNGHFFSLWSSNPDGTNAQLVYGNFTKRPQATLEPRSIPNSNKIIFTAAAHHSITGGSLVLLDQTKGNEGEAPLTRLTPDVPFPETERNVDTFYANPWPLSEDFYLVSWSNQKLPPHGRYEDDRNPANAQGIYLCDRFGNLELLYRDPAISSMTPIPIKPRPKPPVYSGVVDWDGEQVGSVVVQDVYRGMDGIRRGDVKQLRVIGVVPKVQPRMNVPSLGVSAEETGKFVMGTVPVEGDGSAHFRVPSGVPLFFQALDDDGYAIQTMRSLTYLQPGQTLSCIGCHEPRESAPTSQIPVAMQRGPSKIRLDTDGTWPLRFDTLVQPVLERNCIQCHQPSDPNSNAAKLDLTPGKAWHSLIHYANDDLSKLVFERDASIPGFSPARESRLLKYLQVDPLHRKIDLTRDDIQRFVTWIDTYGHTQGAFSAEQEQQLEGFREQLHDLFE